MSANDDLTRSKGYREFESFFANPLNAEKYSKAEYQKLYDDNDKTLLENLKKECELVLLNNR